MATLKVYDEAGNLTSATIPVDDRIFTADGSEHLVYEAVTFHLGNRRQGTHKTKERSEVRASRRTNTSPSMAASAITGIAR